MGGRFLFGVITSLLFTAGALVADGGSSPKTATTSGPPEARVDDVVDTLHGRKIADPYRWMENADSLETRAYTEAQMAYTRGILDAVPGRDTIHARLSTLLAIGTIETPQVGGPYFFHTERKPGQNQPVLYVRKGLHEHDRALVDANQLSPDGTIALDWWYASPDGKLVAYGLSQSGSEKSTLHVIETATSDKLSDVIEDTRYSSIAWKSDNSGFYYTRYPHEGTVPAGEESYNQRVYYHALGTDPAKDPRLFGEGRKPEDVYALNLSEDNRWLVIIAEQGWAKSELFLQDTTSNAAPGPVAVGKNFLYHGEVHRGTLYILTNEDAPRYRVFTVTAGHPERANWKEIIPQSDAVLTSFVYASDHLLVQFERNASSLLKVFTSDGKHARDIALPGLGTVNAVGGEWNSKHTFFDFESYTFPPAIYHHDVTTGKTQLWSRVNAPGVNPSPYEVKQIWCTSKDGTRVPMFIVSRKGLELNGHNPTVLYGYGGFNVSQKPSFIRGLYLWLEHGGVYAEANLRGGSEFGEDWHRAGMLEQKQNVFDDFAAAAEYLIAQKYTDSDHLAIRGGSNGGLLVGAAMTQHPDLYRAVICQVPLLDMLRYQNFQIAKLWIPEYGVSDDPSQFEWLYAYSPYHHVRKGVLYPAVMFMTGDTDSRVDPMHAKKMTALMQAEAKNGADRNRPILLRLETKAGHGQGKPVSKTIEENTDMYSFLMWQLGMKL